MKIKGKIIIVLTVAALGMMALASPALAGTPNPASDSENYAVPPDDLSGLLGDPPGGGTIGDPPGPVPPDEPTPVGHRGSEGPCIDGYKEVTDYTVYSDGSIASSITKVPCGDIPDNPGEPQEPTPPERVPTLTTTRLPNTGVSLLPIAFIGTVFIAAAAGTLVAARKHKEQ